MSNALFLGTPQDTPYVPLLKGFFNGLSTFVNTNPMTMLGQLEMYCSSKNITKVVSTNTHILQKLLELQGNIKTDPKLSEYAGSLFTYKNLEVVFINPLDQLQSISYGKFITQRFISKVAASESWAEPTKFSFEVLTPSNIDSFYEKCSRAIAIATDIETTKTNLAIRCVGYTAVGMDSSGSLSTTSGVLPLNSEWALAWIRKINVLPVPKIFQNGKYDNSYFLRYNAPPSHWFWDTAHFMHAWYSELPKDLAFLNAFFLRNVIYWKDLAETNDLLEYYKYNALDTWATANVWIQQLLTAPDWARRNYFLEFPLVFPCLLSEMTGIKRDQEKLISARKEIDEKESKMLTRLTNMLGQPKFNPGSWQQVSKLMKVLGCGDIQGTGVKELAKARLRHPLNELLLGMISRRKEESGDSIRGIRKLKSNYLRLDSDADKGKDNGAKEFHGRVLYSLNPHGTDTARLASREHHFWTGLQIQNIPRGIEVKQTICADDGFFLGECDLEQAESRDTAYISGDENLIAAVTSDKDFHSNNASAFFGKPYEDIYDDRLKKTKDKPLRDLSKRTNHGANYNMGVDVLVDTMGLENIWKAKTLLKLPFYQPAEIAEYLLCKFHITYPGLKGQTVVKSDVVRNFLKLPDVKWKLYAPGTYYASVANEISVSKKLVSRAFHHTAYNLDHYNVNEYIDTGDWTRYCFGKPDTNKLDLNSYVAHCPQSLNARTLNEAYMEVFYKIALPNPETFRLHAQIHDSILFSYKEGFESHAERVRECMEIPVTVRDIHGIYRIFIVPAALKLGKIVNGELVRAKYWVDTE